MKKIVTLFFVLMTFVSYGQMVTFDATNAMNMTESINTALDQLDKLEEMTNYYEKAQDQIQKVNKVVLKLEEIREIAKMHREILNDVDKAKKSISKITHDGSRKLYTDRLLNILKTAQKITRELSDVTQDNYLNMTDKERIDFVKEKETQMKAQKARMRLLF